MTLVTKGMIYQSADYRLSDLSTGALVDNASPKVIFLEYGHWRGFVTYTGLGRWQYRDTSQYILEWLTGMRNATPHDIALRLQSEGNKWLRSAPTPNLQPRVHTFILSAIFQETAQVYMISNNQVVAGRRPKQTVPSLEITHRKYAGSPFFVVAGMTQGVIRRAKKRIRELSRERPENPSKIRYRLAELHRLAAMHPAAHKYVSKEGIVFSLDKYGGIADKDGREDKTFFVSMTFGIPDIDITKSLPPGYSVVGAGLGFERPRTTQEHCRGRIVRQGSMYSAIVLHIADFVSWGAIDISENNQIIGNADVAATQSRVMWTHSLDIVRTSHDATSITIVPAILPIAGTLYAQNSRGTLVGSAIIDNGSTQHAFCAGYSSIDNQQLLTFVIKQGKESGALAVNNLEEMAGWVGIDPASRSQTNYRPCVWNNGLQHTLEEENFAKSLEWAQAIDINDERHVLVSGMTKAEPTPEELASKDRQMSIGEILTMHLKRHARQKHVVGLWDLKTNRCDFTFGISGIAINSHSMILGKAIDFRLAYRKPAAGLWEPLGTPPILRSICDQ